MAGHGKSARYLGTSRVAVESGRMDAGEMDAIEGFGNHSETRVEEEEDDAPENTDDDAHGSDADDDGIAADIDAAASPYGVVEVAETEVGVLVVRMKPALAVILAAVQHMIPEGCVGGRGEDRCKVPCLLGEVVASRMAGAQEEVLILQTGHEVCTSKVDSSGHGGRIHRREGQRAEEVDEEAGPNVRPQGRAGNTCLQSGPCVSWLGVFHHLGASHRQVVSCVVL